MGSWWMVGVELVGRGGFYLWRIDEDIIPVTEALHPRHPEVDG